MKKFLSVLLVAAMLVTTLVVATVSVSAVDGDWSVYAIKSQYLDGYADIMRDVPGYKYTDEGLQMIPSTWKDSTPYATFQTTEPVNLKEGVYLEVRVDQFTYDAGDKWFGLSIWDQQNVELGKQGDDYGYGVETLIRIAGTSEADAAKYNAEDPTTWPGAMRGLEWYKDLEEGQRIRCTNTANDKLYVNKFVDAEGNEVTVADGETEVFPIIIFEIVWDADSETYAISINGAPAPDAYNQAATDYFAELDDQAYVGFSLQNNTMGGTLGCTILKYGTSAEDAAPPQGDDEAAPDAYSNETAPIADASTIPEGEPAIVLNGSRSDSNVKGKPTSVLGNIIVVNDDNSINVLANTDNMANAKYIVDNEVSYDTKDFPYVLLITRNFCTCNYTDSDMDGVPEEYCTCTESVNMLALAGNLVQESSSYAAKSAPLSYWEPTYVGDDFYHYFVFDWSSIAGLEGRINGLRVDVAGMKGSDAERNNFDIVALAFFRTEAEANAYFEAYIEELGGGEVTPPTTDTDPGDDPTTEPGDDDPTTEPGDDNPTTEPGDENPTTEPGDDVTEKETTKTEETEKAPATSGGNSGDKTDDKKEEKKSGCGGVVGFGAIAVVAIAAAGLVSFKKKED